MRWLFDEMFPPEAAESLRPLRHDAVSVQELGLERAPDELLLELAIAQDRVLVTENFRDFARLIQHRGSAPPQAGFAFVRKSSLPRRGAMPEHLAQRLHACASQNPETHPGIYWP